MTPAAKFNRDMARLVRAEVQSCLDTHDAERFARASMSTGTALAVVIAASMGGDRKAIKATLDEVLNHITLKLDQLSSEFGK